jgi:hypothetical protein
MRLIPLGILGSAGSSGTYELIESRILTSSTSSFTFSNLGTYASIYEHLQIRCLVRTDRSANNDAALVRLNNDTGGRYTNHVLSGTGSGVSSLHLGTASSIRLSQAAGALSTSNSFAASTMDILDAFSNNKNKTTRTLTGAQLDASLYRVELYSGLYREPDSITSITVLPEGGPNFVSGSRFSLYGIR